MVQPTREGDVRIARVLLIGFVLVLFIAVLPVAAMGGADSRLTRLLGRAFCRVLLALVGVRVRLIGAAPGRGRARLLVSNHVSWLDPVVFGSLEPLCPLAKQEVASWPVVSWFARLQKAVFVDRTRRMQIPRVNREMAARLSEGCSLLFFPEGTTLDGTRRGRFLTSHLGCLAVSDGADRPHHGAWVQAAALAYSDPAAAWVGDATLLPHLWSLLGRRGLVCTLTYGSTHRVEPGFDRKRLGIRLAQDVEALLAADHVREGHPYSPAARAA